MRVAVIGAGIVGLATALELVKRGHAVVVYDPEEPGLGASFGNAGIVSTGACVPLLIPGLLRRLPSLLFDHTGPLAISPTYLPRIAPWLFRLLRAGTGEKVERISTGIKSLLDQSIPAYQRLLGDGGFRRHFAHKGLLHAYRSRLSFEQARFSLDLRQRRGVNFQVIGQKEIGAIEPALSGQFEVAVRYPDTVHAISLDLLISHIAIEARQRGCFFQRARVTRIAFGMKGSLSVESGDSDTPVDRVVIAAGAYSRPLSTMCGARVPLDTERGYHAHFHGYDGLVTTPFISVDDNVCITPMTNGLRITGIVEFAGVSAPPDYRRAERLMRIARRLFPPLEASQPSFWMGRRPSLPDTLPAIGPSPTSDRVVFAFGHGHGGIGYGAITAEIVADLLEGRKPSIDITAYSPARFHH